MGGKARKPAAAKVTVFHYPRCGTCRNALKWLDARSVDYTAIDLVETPPSPTQLRDMWARSGLPIRKLFNTAGQSYRQGGFRDRLASMSDDDALAALAADGKLIKRPLVDAGDRVLVGFDQAAYARVFA